MRLAPTAKLQAPPALQPSLGPSGLALVLWLAAALIAASVTLWASTIAVVAVAVLVLS